MAKGFRFENFSPGAKRPDASVPDASVEPQLTEAYETGYRAGWDDAARNFVAEHQKIGADLAARLAEIALTAEDARAEMLMALQPLLLEMVAKVLPSISRETLGPQILEVLRPMVDAAIDPTVQMVVNPQDRQGILSVIEQHVSCPVNVVEEDVVGNGQVFLRVGGSEKSVDLQEVLGEMQSAIGAFYSSGPEPTESANG